MLSLRKSFGFRLTLHLVLFLIITTAAFTYWHVSSQTELTQRSLQTLTDANTRLLSISLRNSIQEQDLSAIETQLINLSFFEGIETIRVLSPQGHILSEVIRKPNGRLQPSFRYGKENLTLESGCLLQPVLQCLQPILVEKQTLGWVAIIANPAYTNGIVNQIRFNALTQLLTLLVLSTLIVLPIVRKQTKTVLRTAQFASKIHSDYGKTMTVDTDTYEVYTLGRSLNRNSELLFQQQQELQQKNALLEHQKYESQQRAQELDTNYRISEILQSQHNSIASKLQSICYLLAAVSSGEENQVTITINGLQYQSSDQPNTSNPYVQNICAGNTNLGEISIATRLATDLNITEGERQLLAETARKIAIALSNHRVEQELRNAQTHLEHRVMERTEQLELARDIAEQNHNVKSAFINTISQELRTPLNAILGFAQILDSPQNSASENNEYTQQIIKSSKRLLEHIDNILDLSILEQRPAKLKSELTNLNEVIHSAVASLNSLSTDKNVKIYINCLESLDIFTDRQKLFRVISILLSNTIKASNPKDNITLILNRNFEGKAVISIIDACKGNNTLYPLFDSHQASYLENIKAVDGIELSITKHIVGLLEGKVEVNRVPGKGREFKIYLDNLAA